MFQRPKKITIYNPIQICVIAAVEKNEEKKKMKKKNFLVWEIFIF